MRLRPKDFAKREGDKRCLAGRWEQWLGLFEKIGGAGRKRRGIAQGEQRLVEPPLRDEIDRFPCHLGPLRVGQLELTVP